MRKQAVENDRVEYDSKDGETACYGQSHRHGDSFVDGIWILEGVVFEGEVLVEGFDLIDDEECNDEGSVGFYRVLC